MSAEIVPSEDGSLEFSKNLPNAPGWVALSQQEKTEVQNLTSDILKSLQGSNMLALRGAMGVVQMERYLEGKPLSFTRWAEAALGPSRATIFRMKKKIQEALGRHSEDALLYLADHGIPGANNAQLGHIVNALEKVKPIKSTKATELKGFAEGVGEVLKKGYSERRLGNKPILYTEDEVVTKLVMEHRGMRRSLAELTSAQKAKLLKRTWGYALQVLAIPGTIQVERTSIPEGVLPPRGAPKGKRKKGVKKP